VLTHPYEKLALAKARQQAWHLMSNRYYYGRVWYSQQRHAGIMTDSRTDKPRESLVQPKINPQGRQGDGRDRLHQALGQVKLRPWRRPSSPQLASTFCSDHDVFPIEILF
jgi:hypothetical protein